MRRTLLIFCFNLLAISLTLQAQVKIGDNLTTVNANSILELESTTKALLLPRLGNAQIQAMQNVPAGMLVYSNTDNVLLIRTNTGWTTLALAANSASATNPWTTNGSTIYANKMVGIGTSQPFSQLANNSGNTSGSDGQGGNVGSLSWAASQPGYVGQIYNSSAAALSNGLVVKVNSTTATALDVSQGTQSSSANPLLTVKSDGKVGIRTSNPATALDVNGEIKANTFNLGLQYYYEDYSLQAGYLGIYLKGCPQGTKAIGGGGGHRDSNQAARDIEVAYSGPDPEDTSYWKLIIENNGSSTRAIRSYVICAKVN